MERLFSSSLVAIVSLAAPRKLKVCHFKVSFLIWYITKKHPLPPPSLATTDMGEGCGHTLFSSSCLGELIPSLEE